MEYILARNWVDKIQESSVSEQGINEIIGQVVESFFSFPTSFGALLFLDKMLEREGRLINQTIIKIARDKNAFSSLRQTATLYAFENIAVNDIEEEVIDALEKFESIAGAEIKDRLAKVILKVLGANSNHPKLRRMVEKILEIKPPDVSNPFYLAPPVRPASARNFSSPIFGKKFPVAETAKDAAIYDSKRLLPPATDFHYSDEIKLSAIGILISWQQKSDYDLAVSGMNKLGQMEIHSALEALSLWDTADDEQVIRVIHSYIGLKHAEFRMYCAWLLRNRYGRKPADLLVDLLTDKETRVHEYTFKLFSERFIEEELIEKIIEKIRDIELKPWHLKHLIKLFSAPDRFVTDALLEKHGSRIAQTLRKVCSSINEPVRLESYRALLKYVDFVDLDWLRAAISRDTSFYICNLSVQLQKRS